MSKRDDLKTLIETLQELTEHMKSIAGSLNILSDCVMIRREANTFTVEVKNDR